MLQHEQQLDGVEAEFFTHLEDPELFASSHSIHFPLPDSGPLMEKVYTLHHSDFIKDIKLLGLYFNGRVASIKNLITEKCLILLYKQVKRFHLLLTVKDTAMYIPSNLEARRRISFFATSLFMDMPKAPKVRNMLSFRWFCLLYFSVFYLVFHDYFSHFSIRFRFTVS